jgi:simple sugar transport system ATP-binding protein
VHREEHPEVPKQGHALTVCGLVKHFGHVRANDGLDLDFAGAEMHALLGENGAGKSTVIKILAGIYQPDAGEILLDDTPLRLESPMDARKAGICVVHQDSTLVPRLTVFENVVLQEGGLGRPAPDLGDRLVAAGKRLNFVLDPRAYVETLTPGDRQRVEIARALMSDARFMILDEPTGVLAPQEKAAFFAVLGSLVAEGIGVIFVTHHIGEALRYSERVTVLRAGRVVGKQRQPADKLDEETVVRMMVGDIEPRRDRPSRELGEECLRVTGISGRYPGGRALDDVSFSVRAGEVLGIAGVEGDGQRELAAAITGAWSPDRGSVEIRGRRLQEYSRAQRARMIADVPDDHLLATVNSISVWENFGIAQLAWQEAPTPACKRRVRGRTREAIEQFRIRTTSVNAPVAHLSGGNRRRLVLARELSKEPDVAVLAFATKGLDVRSVAQMKEWTQRLAAEGAAVVYIAADLEEVLDVSDRIAVLAHGQIRGILDASEADVQTIGQLMLGGSVGDEVAP